MKFFDGFLTIPSESIKLLCKNVKFITVIVLTSVALSSVLFLLFCRFAQILASDILETLIQSLMHNPSSLSPYAGFDPTQIVNDQIRKDTSLILTVLLAFAITTSIISFFSSITTIQASIRSYQGPTSSLKEAYSRIGSTCKRAFVTGLHRTALTSGYTVFVIAFATPLLIYPNNTTYNMAIFIGIIASVFFLYSSVSLEVALVISVAKENCYGSAALAKAEVLVTGHRLHGFLINLAFGLVLFCMCSVYKNSVLGEKQVVDPTIGGLIVVDAALFLHVLYVVVCTALYLQCEKQSGEDPMDLIHGGVEYTKLSSLQLTADVM